MASPYLHTFHKCSAIKDAAKRDMTRARDSISTKEEGEEGVFIPESLAITDQPSSRIEFSFSFHHDGLSVC